MKGEIVFDSVEGELFMYILLSCSKWIKWSFVFKFMLDHVLCPMDHTEKKKKITFICTASIWNFILYDLRTSQPKVYIKCNEVV